MTEAGFPAEADADPHFLDSSGGGTEETSEQAHFWQAGGHPGSDLPSCRCGCPRQGRSSLEPSTLRCWVGPSPESPVPHPGLILVCKDAPPSLALQMA